MSVIWLNVHTSVYAYRILPWKSFGKKKILVTQLDMS